MSITTKQAAAWFADRAQNTPPMPGAREMFKFAADALREKAERENPQPLTPVQEWVSVKDRLPDVGCDVLFVCENKSCGVGAYSDTYRDFFSGKFPAKGVTHWMPLPEPPKEV